MCSGHGVEEQAAVLVAAVGAGALTAVCDALRVRDLAGLDEAALRAEVETLTAVAARVSAERLRCVAAVAGRSDDRRAGQEAAQRLLQTAGRLSGGQAVRDSRLATALTDPKLAPTGQALADGRISPNQADVLARAARSHPRLFAEQQAELVEQAAGLDDRAFRNLMDDRRHAADPRPEEQRAARQYAARRLTMASLPDGMMRVDGLLDPFGGAKVRTALDALAAPDPATVPEDERRTPEQRLADALVHLADRALARSEELPTTAGLQPKAIVFLTPETLADDPGAPAADLDWSGRITGATARRIACDADVVRRLVTRDGRTVALDVRRYPSPAQRLTVIERDRHCRFVHPDGPRCERPWQWCDIHHVEHHGNGGPTLIPNLALLCTQHHHAVHEGGWMITGEADQTLVFHPPLGWPHHRPGHPPPQRSSPHRPPPDRPPGPASPLRTGRRAPPARLRR